MSTVDRSGARPAGIAEPAAVAGAGVSVLPVPATHGRMHLVNPDGSTVAWCSASVVDSGGPWLVDYDHGSSLGYVNAITSRVDEDRTYTVSSYFGEWVAELYYYVDQGPRGRAVSKPWVIGVAVEVEGADGRRYVSASF
ncbi:hypothetical protein ACFV4N_17755 [Actinosynnema sp. NPDC059797]